MKGIVLAGGSGTRLYPLTRVVNKQLLPVYDKPMVYYPISTLMMAGINEILVISTPEDLPHFKNLLGDGERIGCRFSYAAQPKPNGLAQAFVIGEEFIGDDSVALVLGDNLFFGGQLKSALSGCASTNGAIVFAYIVPDPRRFGIIEFDNQMRAISLEEKPNQPRSNFAVPGLYFYDNEVVKIARSISPSERGEYEITDVNQAYLDRGKLDVRMMNDGIKWIDTGTFASIQQASEFVREQTEKGIGVGCIEEVAWRSGFIDLEQLGRIASDNIASGYGIHLSELECNATEFAS